MPIRMKRTAGVLVALCLGLPAVGVCASPVSALPVGTEVQRYRGGLDFPVDAVTLPGTKTILFTGKYSGKIEVIENRTLQQPCAALNVGTEGERGLLGITLDPNFATNHYLYVFYTAKTRPRKNRVDRFTYNNGSCEARKHIVLGLRSAFDHNGGQIEFLDEKLFVTVGEGAVPSRAQNLETRQGKILRYNPDGSIPADNPFNEPGEPSPVWSYGHRNMFGLAVDPNSGRLYETENGPECDDEINLILEGENYGWGDGYQCGTAGVGPTPTPPLYRFLHGDATVAPTDAWWYEGKMESLAGSLYAGDYNGGRIHRFDLSEDGTAITRHRVIWTEPSDPVLDVFEGPGGWLYFLTYRAVKRIVPADL